MKQKLLIFSKRIVFILSVSIILFSCSKTKNNTSCTLSTSALLGTWLITDASYKATASSASIDVYKNTDYTDACDWDNATTFKSNDVFTFNDIGVTCSPIDSTSGVWTLSNDTLYTSNTLGASYPSLITSFNCTSMVIAYTDWNATGDEIFFTYTKQ